MVQKESIHQYRSDSPAQQEFELGKRSKNGVSGVLKALGKSFKNAPTLAKVGYGGMAVGGALGLASVGLLFGGVQTAGVMVGLFSTAAFLGSLALRMLNTGLMKTEVDKTKRSNEIKARENQKFIASIYQRNLQSERRITNLEKLLEEKNQSVDIVQDNTLRNKSSMVEKIDSKSSSSAPSRAT